MNDECWGEEDFAWRHCPDHGPRCTGADCCCYDIHDLDDEAFIKRAITDGAKQVAAVLHPISNYQPVGQGYRPKRAINRTQELNIALDLIKRMRAQHHKTGSYAATGLLAEVDEFLKEEETPEEFLARSIDELRTNEREALK